MTLSEPELLVDKAGRHRAMPAALQTIRNSRLYMSWSVSQIARRQILLVFLLSSAASADFNNI
jgi:hypothetical protein